MPLLGWRQSASNIKSASTKLEKRPLQAAAVYECIYHKHIYIIENSNAEHIECAKWIKQQRLCNYTVKIDEQNRE